MDYHHVPSHYMAVFWWLLLGCRTRFQTGPQRKSWGSTHLVPGNVLDNTTWVLRRGARGWGGHCWVASYQERAGSLVHYP